eukprot:6978945-Pyramimonas_sp.AAC.1
MRHSRGPAVAAAAARADPPARGGRCRQLLRQEASGGWRLPARCWLAGWQRGSAPLQAPPPPRQAHRGPPRDAMLEQEGGDHLQGE